MLAKVFTILYEEAAEEDLRGLRVYEARRIMDEVDTQLTKKPAMATRAIRRKGTKTTREIL